MLTHSSKHIFPPQSVSGPPYVFISRPKMQLSGAPRRGLLGEMPSEWPALTGRAVQRPAHAVWGAARVSTPACAALLPPPGLESVKETRRSSDVLSDGSACTEATRQPDSDSDVSDAESLAFSVAENVLTSLPGSSTLNINASVFVPRRDAEKSRPSLSLLPPLSTQATPFVPGVVPASVPPPPGLRTALSTTARAYNPAGSTD